MLPTLASSLHRGPITVAKEWYREPRRGKSEPRPRGESQQTIAKAEFETGEHGNHRQRQISLAEGSTEDKARHGWSSGSTQDAARRSNGGRQVKSCMQHLLCWELERPLAVSHKRKR
jgi:hypothetical protein